MQQWSERLLRWELSLGRSRVRFWRPGASRNSSRSGNLLFCHVVSLPRALVSHEFCLPRPGPVTHLRTLPPSPRSPESFELHNQFTVSGWGCTYVSACVWPGVVVAPPESGKRSQKSGSVGKWSYLCVPEAVFVANGNTYALFSSCSAQMCRMHCSGPSVVKSHSDGRENLAGC